MKKNEGFDIYDFNREKKVVYEIALINSINDFLG